MRQRVLGWSVACVVLVLATGCGRELEEEMAEGVVQASLETTRSGSAARPVVDVAERTCPIDPEAMAAEIAQKPAVGLYPASCASKLATGNTLHVDYDDCTGAFGKVRLNGGIDAFLEASEGCGLHAEVLDSGDLTANGKRLDYEATADVTFADGQRDIDWRAHFAGTTRRGRRIVQSSRLSIVVDDATSCVTLDGKIDGHVGKRVDYDASIEGLAVCPGQCPAAGTVRASVDRKLRDRTLTIVFDGSNAAHVTGWTGREFDVEMVCDDRADD